MFLAEDQVVLVDQRRAGSAGNDADAEGDEHEACGSRGEIFATFVDDWKLGWFVSRFENLAGWR